LNGLDDGPGIGGVGLADGMGVDVSVSEWSLQADPARSRNASAMPLSSFFTIECYDSMRQRNQIYLERRTRPPANSKRAKAYAHKMRRSMNEHDVVHVKETVRATPNFEDTPVEIKAGWCGTIIALASSTGQGRGFALTLSKSSARFN
jgi:hypothetical protein